MDREPTKVKVRVRLKPTIQLLAPCKTKWAWNNGTPKMWSQKLKEQCFKVNSMLRKLTAPQKPSFFPCNDLQELKNNNNNNQRTILWKSSLIPNKPTNLNMNTLCRYIAISQLIIMIILSHMLGTFALGGKWTIPYKGVCKQSSTVYIQLYTFQGFCFYNSCFPPPQPSSFKVRTSIKCNRAFL